MEKDDDDDDDDKTDFRVSWSVDGRIVRSLSRNNYITQKSTETEIHVPRVRATKSAPNIGENSKGFAWNFQC